MTFSRSLHALAATVACALLTAPAALAAEFPKDYPYPIPTSPGSGEDTPLNLDAGKTADQISSGGGGGLVRTIVGLAIVLGVIFGLHWVLKQIKSQREQSGAGAGLLPLATVPLGPGKSLHLVRAGREIVLVGASEQGVTPIRVYTEDEARALGLEIDDPARNVMAADRPKRGGGLVAATRRPAAAPDLRGLLARVQQWTVRG
jgi:flagellar protein FliO/FliZ